MMRRDDFAVASQCQVLQRCCHLELREFGCSGCSGGTFHSETNIKRSRLIRSSSYFSFCDWVLQAEVTGFVLKAVGARSVITDEGLVVLSAEIRRRIG